MRSVMIGLVAVLLVSTAWGQEKLDLRGPETTDEVLAEKVKGLTKLEVLDLYNTKITDAGLVHLNGLTNLKSLNLERTKVTAAGAQALQKALPGCKIDR